MYKKKLTLRLLLTKQQFFKLIYFVKIIFTKMNELTKMIKLWTSNLLSAFNKQKWWAFIHSGRCLPIHDTFTLSADLILYFLLLIKSWFDLIRNFIFNLEPRSIVAPDSFQKVFNTKYLKLNVITLLLTLGTK